MSSLNIVTPRLLLRPVELCDAAATAALVSPAISRELLTWPPQMTVDEARSKIQDSRRLAADDLCVHWGIFLKDELTLIGWTGLTRDPLDPSLWWLGYWLGEAYWRQGYASEAVRAVLVNRALAIGAVPVHAFVRTGNRASIAVLERVGFVGSDRPATGYRPQCDTEVHFRHDP